VAKPSFSLTLTFAVSNSMETVGDTTNKQT